MAENRVVEFAKFTATRARQRWNERRLRADKATLQQAESTGVYLGYDADTEQHQIRLQTGRVINAEAITNAGLDEFDPVVVQGNKFKSMPR